MDQKLQEALRDRPAPFGSQVRLTEYDAWLGIITIDAGTRHNAVSSASWDELTEVCAALRRDDRVRAVVVRGGPSAFSAGADITEFPSRRQTAAQAIGYNGRVSAALRALMDLPVPVIAMIAGYAVGGGCEIAAACDIRIAARTARFGLPLARLGVVQGPVEQQAVLRLIGPARLKWLVFSGRPISAEEAHGIGLVDEVVDEDRLAEATGELLEAVGTSSEASIRATKFLVDHRSAESSDREEKLLEHFLSVYDGPELKAGVAAFLGRQEGPS